MNLNFNVILDKIKTNKKMAILISAVLFVLIILLLSSGNKSNTSDFISQLNTLQESSYVADGNITICDKKLSININKLDTDFSIGLSGDEMDFSNIITKTENTLYINNEMIVPQTGVLTLSNNVQAEEFKTFYEVITEAISNCEGVEFKSDDTNHKMIVNTTENWKIFWNSIYDALNTNIDLIANGYTSPDEIKAQIKTIMSDCKKMAETSSIANTLEISLTTGENTYELSFDATLDLSIAPYFINIKDIDSNKIKTHGTIAFTISDAASIKKPSGALHPMTNVSVNGFFTDLWEIIFSKVEYVSFTEIAVTNNSVSATYKLGDTTENLQLLFDSEGVTKAVWYITSWEKDMIDSYIQKYKTNENQEDFTEFEYTDGTVGVNITVSQNGINTFNKIAKTPKAMGEYFSSSKGGDLIV